MKTFAMLAYGCALLMSGCGLFLERYPDPEDAGFSPHSWDAFSMDASEASSDASELDAIAEFDAIVTTDAYEFPDAPDLVDADTIPDAYACVPESCNGLDDDCDDVVDDGACVVGSVTCTGHIARGHTYILCDTNVTWDTANSRCESIPDFHMVQIDSESENSFVADLAASLDWMRRGGVWDNAPRLWIGLRDNSPTSRDWRWTDGSALGTSYWYPPGPGRLENCGEMRGWNDGSGSFGYGWNDSSCFAPGRAYLCERNGL